MKPEANDDLNCFESIIDFFFINLRKAMSKKKNCIGFHGHEWTVDKQKNKWSNFSHNPNFLSLEPFPTN